MKIRKRIKEAVTSFAGKEADSWEIKGVTEAVCKAVGDWLRDCAEHRRLNVAMNDLTAAVIYDLVAEIDPPKE